MKTQSPLIDSALDTVGRWGLLSDHERSTIAELCAPNGCFAHTLSLAETLHLHIKIDDTDMLPERALLAAHAQLDHRKEGFVKYRFPDGINVIFSHIKIAQEDLIETESNWRPRPFLDHIGIDLREESPRARAAFDELAVLAGQKQWPLVSQGGNGKQVYCCHVQVLEKRWLYPPGSDEHPGIPLEFAYGPLTVNPHASGCDLRPADPRRISLGAIPVCGPSSEQSMRCCSE
jgi:hypothetical protein